MPIILVEGLDKSGKSMLVNLLHSKFKSVLIRKQYNENLYPVNYSIASLYDWQTIFDRIVLANPDTLFIADRSFFTQTIYQLAFGVNSDAITVEQLQMFNNYCKVLSSIQHSVLYCYSKRYELDSVVTSIDKVFKLHNLYKQSLNNLQDVNVLQIDMDALTLEDRLLTVYNFIQSNMQVYENNV